MSERVVVCFGDSHTYGWNAETGRRFRPASFHLDAAGHRDVAAVVERTIRELF